MTTPTEPGSPPDDADPVAETTPEPPLDFDPYRFGLPDHPVPPEYAPPGYRPPAPPVPPPPPQYPANPQYPQSAPYPQNAQYPPYGQYPPNAPYPPPNAPYEQYPQYGAPPPPPYSQYPPARTGNGKAITSLVFGVASILLCWLSLFDVVPIILALVFGFIALGEVSRGVTRDGHGQARAGIACALVGAVLATVLTVVYYNRFRDCIDMGTSSPQYSQCINSHL